MELHNQFSVPVPVEQAWDTLQDLERIAPCLPGATVLSFDGEHCKGQVKVKVGPISLTYGGELTILERDESRHVLVMSGQGKETRGTSSASARVTASLNESAGVTTVDVHTDLELTGKPAQFGRGIIADVSNRLIGRFAENLSALILAPPSEPTPEPTYESVRASLAAAPEATGSSTRAATARAATQAEALDAFSLLPAEVTSGLRLAGIGALLFLVGWLLGARRS